MEIPYEYEKKSYTDTKKREISLIFFGKEIKVFKDSGNEGVFCDTIESVDMMSLFGNIKLPVGMHTVKDAFYTTETERYTPEEAMNIAYYRLERQIASELPDASILKKTVKGEIGDEAYILECTVTCIEDIAQISEFSVDLS